MTERPGLTCREFIEFLAAYLDDEVPASERERFEAHLRVCASCVEYLASYRETIRLTAESARTEGELIEDAPEELIRAVLAARRR